MTLTEAPIHHDVEPRLTPEQAAISKIVDIHAAPYFRHAFVRFGPIDPIELFAPEPEHVNPKVDRLDGVLKCGFVSHKVAEQLGIGMSRNLNDPRNWNHVSLAVPVMPISHDFGFAIQVTINGSKRKIPVENIFVFLVSDEIDTYPSKRFNPKNVERMRRGKTSPANHKGIVILDDSARVHHEMGGIPLQEKVDWGSSTPQQTAQMLGKKMKEIYADQPHLAVPVYGYSGDVLWPTYIPYENVRNRITQKN